MRKQSKKNTFLLSIFIVFLLILLIVKLYGPIKNHFSPKYIDDFNTAVCGKEKNLPLIKAKNTNTPPKDMIDVASYNNNISVQQYEKMKKYGIKVVVVKLTEGTTYTNSFYENQVKNAITACLKVNIYHYARYIDKKSATREAQFFVAVAQKIGLQNSTVAIVDVEAKKTLKKKNLTTLTKAWLSEVEKTYPKTSVYASLNIYKKRKLKVDKLGTTSKLWGAYYPSLINKNTLYNSDYSAWQFSKKLKFTNKNMPKMCFDISTLYNDYFK